MRDQTGIIFCRCSANVVSNNTLDQVAERLRDLDAKIFELQDLCAVSIAEKDFLAGFLKSFSRKVIVACYPRAVKNMILQAGLDFEGVDTFNFKEFTADQIISKIKEDIGIEVGIPDYQVIHSDLEVPAWYPVIDESRCTLCGKCARFCLFGVYQFTRKNLKVVNPLACKNNCPACGRTCPASAILFPRMPEKTPLAGAEPGIIQKNTGDMIVMLNERNRNRQNIFRTNIVQQAENERRKALEEMKHTLNRKN